MTQKVLKVGDSAAVIIPKKSLKELGLNFGDEVIVDVDRKKKSVSIHPSQKMTKRQNRIAELTFNFISGNCTCPAIQRISGFKRFC